MAERHRDLERLLTFVDAVVAIAITLLVLPLAEIGQEVGDVGAAELLQAHSDDLLGFVLSFVVIARLWLAQHHTVRSLERQSPPLIWLLLAWTFTIVFLPFPTSLVATTRPRSPSRRSSTSARWRSARCCCAVIAWAIRSDDSLRDSDEKPDVGGRRSACAVGFLVALAVMLAFPDTGYWPLLLLLLVDPVARVARRVCGPDYPPSDSRPRPCPAPRCRASRPGRGWASRARRAGPVT